MRRKGYQVTRYADDLGGHLQVRGRGACCDRCSAKDTGAVGRGTTPAKTRVVHVRQGFEFLGYKIKRGQRQLKLMPHKIKSGVRAGNLYAYPKGKSIQRFMDQVRERTKRRIPVTTSELIATSTQLSGDGGITKNVPTSASSSTD